MFWLLLFSAVVLEAQVPFDVKLRAVAVADLQGVHSFAYAQLSDQIVVIGGRKDGLHKRLPWEAFAEGGKNTTITLLNLKAKTHKAVTLKHLPAQLRDHLSSTNMQFIQHGNYLLLVGGYGYSSIKDEFITWPVAVQIDLAGLEADLQRDTVHASRFQVIENEAFAVTGGQLRKLGDTLLLVAGHRFDGTYNPLDGPSFTQSYTEAVGRFTWYHEPFRLQHLSPMRNSDLLHRRDLNVIEQIDAQGKPYLTLFSGVFQKGQNYPYLTAVHIHGDTLWEQPDFAQYLNHYHCATLPMFDSKSGAMYTYFFGGIAQYFTKGDLLVQDNEVPFVPTIGCVSRTADGLMAEYELSRTMPALLGASSELILHPSVARVAGTEIVDVRALVGDTISVGYVFGGIESSDANVFWYDELTSQANARLFEVLLIRSTSHDFYQPIKASTDGYQLQIYPNADEQALSLSFTLSRPQEVTWRIEKEGIGLVAETKARTFSTGKHLVHTKVGTSLEAGVYLVYLTFGAETKKQRIIVTP